MAIDKIEKNELGNIVLRDAGDAIIKTLTPDLSQRLFHLNTPDAGVMLQRNGVDLIAVDASQLTRTQIYPAAEQAVAFTPQQLAENLVAFFFELGWETAGDSGIIDGGMERSGVLQVVLNSTPVHNLVIPGIETASVIEFDVQSNCNLTGIAGLKPWGRYTFFNTGTNLLTMPANNINSDPQNRFGAANSLGPQNGREFFYNGTLLKIYPLL